MESQGRGPVASEQGVHRRQYVASASGETFDCISPCDGTLLTQVANCGEEDVDRAVKAARAAFEKGDWRNMAPKDRKTALMRFAQLIEDKTPKSLR